MNNTMSINDLRSVLIESGGGDELPGDISDASFDELGYDSLALINTAALLKRDHGVVIPDEQLTELRTPRDMLSLINDGPAA